MLEIDCRGLACPQPVITTKQALDQMEEGELVVIVDNASSCNNVERFAKSRGCSVNPVRNSSGALNPAGIILKCNPVAEQRGIISNGVKVEQKEKNFYLHLQKMNFGNETEPKQKEEKAKKIVVYINSNLLGGGDEDLGSFLMKAFLKTLLDLETKPYRLILVNSGVQLASEGSKVLEIMEALSEKGVEIFSCGTCINFYELKGKMRVGAITNMYDIIQSMLEADRLIRP